MEYFEPSLIKKKIVGGVFALTSRTFLLQMVSFVSTFVLSILLSPEIFGVFFVVSAIISFLSYFSDVGFAAALIQKKSEPTRDELVSVFTIQSLLVGVIVIGMYSFAPLFSAWYGLSREGVFLLRALLVGFFLSSLKTIPSILLERKLDFGKLVLPQILETVVFYAVAIAFALRGITFASFAWAALARGIVGLIAIYVIYPWIPGFGLSVSAVKHMLSFGLPFQANSILALIKDDLMTIILGRMLPFAHLGYLGWAKKYAEVPLRLIMDSVIRVTFPAYSRLQEDTKVLGKAIEKSLFFLALFIFPITLFMVVYIKPFVDLIPRYSKWEPALFAFYLFSISSVFAAFSSPLVNALNAIGKIKISLLLMVMWTTLTWILYPVLAISVGFNGIAIASCIVSLTSFLPAILLRKVVMFRILAPLKKPAVASGILAVVLIVLREWSGTLWGFALITVVSMSVYAGLAYVFMKDEISPYLPQLLFRKKT